MKIKYRSFEDMHLNEVVYTPENWDTETDGDGYTKQQLIDICNGNPYTAEMVYNLLEWQSPYTLLDELFREGEIDEDYNILPQE